MYHEKIKYGYGYISCYDSFEEVPDKCRVCFPKDDRRGILDMTTEEMKALANQEQWYVVVQDNNYGVCDHWVSIPFMEWIYNRYPIIERYVDDAHQTIGYNRKYKSVNLTHDSHFHHSEVWNS